MTMTSFFYLFFPTKMTMFNMRLKSRKNQVLIPQPYTEFMLQFSVCYCLTSFQTTHEFVI